MDDQTGTFQGRRRGVLMGALALVLIGAVAWVVYRAKQQDRRNVALWEAVESSDLSAVTSLLNESADPNINEYRVLDLRHGRGLAAFVTRLRGREPSYNLDPQTNQWTTDPRVGGNWTTRQKWNTVLWLATEKDRPDIVRALVARGAKDKTTGYLDTALMWAAERGHRDIAQALLASGSDVNGANEWGDTALDGAVMQGDIEMAKLLLQHGADAHRGGVWERAKAGGQQAMVDLIEKARVENEGMSARAMP